MNADTICSLQIFEDESHPNFHMQGQGGRGKEGLSLFGGSHSYNRLEIELTWFRDSQHDPLSSRPPNAQAMVPTPLTFDRDHQ